MVNALVIEEVGNLEYVRMVQQFSNKCGNDISFIAKSWNLLLTGKGGSTRIARLCKSHNVNTLFIHFSSRFTVDEAKEMVDSIRNHTNVRLVIITNVDAENTFGVKLSLNKPVSADEMIRLALMK